MNYKAAAKVMDDLIVELIGRGMDIPGHVIEDIKDGRSFASILLRQPDDEIERQTAVSLQNAEMNLLSAAEAAGGRDYAENWQRCINDAYMEDTEVRDETAPPAKAPTFVSGVPKGEYWIRVRESELSPIRNDFEKLLVSCNLNALVQEDGYVLLYGKKENVSSFLKDIRQKIGKKETICNGQ